MTDDLFPKVMFMNGEVRAGGVSFTIGNARDTATGRVF